MSEHNIQKFILALKERRSAFPEAVEALGRTLREAAGFVDGRAAERVQLATAVAMRPGMHGVRTVPRGRYR